MSIDVEPLTENEQAEVDRDFDEFWAPIVLRDGTLDLEAVKRELHDYHVTIREVNTVYCHITQGRISKPNTLASAVIGVVDELLMQDIDEALKEQAEAFGGE